MARDTARSPILAIVWLLCARCVDGAANRASGGWAMIALLVVVVAGGCHKDRQVEDRGAQLGVIDRVAALHEDGVAGSQGADRAARRGSRSAPRLDPIGVGARLRAPVRLDALGARRSRGQARSKRSALVNVCCARQLVTQGRARPMPYLSNQEELHANVRDSNTSRSPWRTAAVHVEAPAGPLSCGGHRDLDTAHRSRGAERFVAQEGSQVMNVKNAASASDRLKVRAEHLTRTAYVYVRQSSLRQVRTNLESQRLQYGFAEQAAALGWDRERIVVVDEDQGRSGAMPQSRAGFGDIVAAVARGEVGVVMSFELSRLSRNDLDWHHLVFMCRWTSTLIADEQGLYDPSSSADRMVLGIRGQVSELERDSSVHRMVEARWNKARRGEAFTIPPAGYDLDETGQLQLSSDEAVLVSVRRVFEKFDELGAARQVYLWWRGEGLDFPVRRTMPRSHPIVWVPVSYRAIYTMLRHPIYAGAFVFGRHETRRELDPETQKVVLRRGMRRRREDWPVLIKDHHPAYISFEKYLDNQKRLRANAVMGQPDESHQGAAREGRALLQGLLRCGHCGRRMYVNFGGTKAARTLQYRCSRQRLLSLPECQLVGGKRIEAAVVEAFLESTDAAGAEAAALAGGALQKEIEAAERSWSLRIEKAEYEAQRAERQYNAVEPENRTVARELERRWNERMLELEELRAQAAATREHRRPLTEHELERARELGQNLPAVWNASTTTVRDRKRLLRAVIDEIQLRTEDKRHLVRIVWKGEAVTDREVVRFRQGESQHTTSEDIVELVRKLAPDFDDTQIACILNRKGLRSGLGLAFTKSSVCSLRGHNRIPACPKRNPRNDREGPFTADEAARELGVSMHTVHRWLRDGVLAGVQATPWAPWRIVLTEEVRRRLAGGAAPEGWVGLSEAARRLGISKSLAAHWVKQGKLKAFRTTVGKRHCWKIDVSSTDPGRQADLLDRMGNASTKEP